MSVRTSGPQRLDSPAGDPHDLRSPAGPVRTCIGCREKAAKRELLRVVAGDGTVVPDPDGSAPGRGAHLHPRLVCFELAGRRRAFTRALRYDAGAGGPLDVSELERYLTDHDRSPR